MIFINDSCKRNQSHPLDKKEPMESLDDCGCTRALSQEAHFLVHDF